MILNHDINQLVSLLNDRPVENKKIKRGAVEGMYESKHPDFKVHVEYSAKHAWVTLIFQQRPGTWFRLGDFPEAPQYKAALKFFYTKVTSARTDLGLETVPQVAEFLKQVLK